MKKALNASEDSGHVIRWAPSVLKDVQTELAVRIYIRMEHARQEFHGRRLVWVALIEC